MTESRSARRRESQRRIKKLGENRRWGLGAFGYVIAGLAGAGIGVGVAPRIREGIDNYQLEQRTADFRRTITVPDTQITNEQLQTVSQEGWLEEIVIDYGPDFNSLPTEEKMSRYMVQVTNGLDDVTSRMLRSENPYFKLAAERLNKYQSTQSHPYTENGYIKLDSQFYKEGIAGEGMFLAGADVDSQGKWYMRLTNNLLIFDEKSFKNFDRRLRVKMNIAVALVHELLGHHSLSELMFGFYARNGLSHNEAFPRVKSDPYQEPYSYWMQTNSMAIMESLGENYTQQIAEFFTIINDKRKKLSPEKAWYSPEWVSEVKEFSDL